MVTIGVCGLVLFYCYYTLAKLIRDLCETWRWL